MAKPPRLLAIAGSDSSGGAGIQADIKTACAFGVYAMTAVTAVTAQDTTGVHAIHPIPAAIVREQLSRCLADIGADAIKIGMLGSAEIVDAVADILEREARGIPLVLDPVLASTSGTPLIDAHGIERLKSRLIPLASLVTPNIPEAEILAGPSISQELPSLPQTVMARECGPPSSSANAPRQEDAMRREGSAIAGRTKLGGPHSRAMTLKEREQFSETREGIERECRALMAMGAKAVLVKGGHSGGAMIEDILLWERGIEMFEIPRIDTQHTHGTGCTLATAIACGLAEGLTLPDSVRRARKFVQSAIATAPGFGHGHGPLNHSMGSLQERH